MGSFISRDIQPVDASYPVMPDGLFSMSQSGKTQFRAVQHVGRQWTELYGLIDPETDTGRAFLHEAMYLKRTGTIFNITHPLLMTQRGAGGGTPLVQGGSQTGANLVSDGWPNSTMVLKVGDILYFGQPDLCIRDVTANVTSNGSGVATIPIDPPIFAGGSPADNAPITFGALTWRVRIVALESPVGSFTTLKKVSGLRVTMRESAV